MISGTQIHHWLQQPDLLLQEDVTALTELEQDYPYFSIVPLMTHYQRAGNVINRDLLEIYGYNPVVFHYWKDQAETWSTLTSQETAISPEAEIIQDKQEEVKDADMAEEELIFELPAVDYFANQGIDVSAALPEKEALEEMTMHAEQPEEEDADKSLLVVMSFGEWLQFLQHKTRHEQQEEREKRALKAMWQRQKLAEAIEEESDEIPASVFEMAVNSISREDGVVSESMAIVYAKQGKIRESIEMYQKLCLKNPDKSVYFAHKIENLQKELK